MRVISVGWRNTRLSTDSSQSGDLVEQSPISGFRLAQPLLDAFDIVRCKASLTHFIRVAAGDVGSGTRAARLLLVATTFPSITAVAIGCLHVQVRSKRLSFKAASRRRQQHFCVGCHVREHTQMRRRGPDYCPEHSPRSCHSSPAGAMRSECRILTSGFHLDFVFVWKGERKDYRPCTR